MDDMDRQSEELGGKATFFTGEFKKYRWAQLLDKRYSGHERLLLYAEGIEKMNENKNIPQLFRDIFKGVFLPYRDPETLNLFLKEIDGFTYDHSERLGDAFEYLLSVLGTQGDAGQFRTPRHIIDFIVAVVDSKKNETILDPACGTAGFLISAYKHILKSNESLTPDERAWLMTNFRGYDFAPDMVRLARANMYLHGFPNPTIHEYDTLTSEERWDERYDVILANPPFMSPKGGIRPHNRFSIKAKRSEVLFVDYIAEHLSPGGRAGIIVPEGIIFQSQTAYKQLRKMLVEESLIAVVSLPAGVFNPYANVKTSILLLDKTLARKTNAIAFFKVENDGFGLGAQRRPIEKNDLHAALAAITNYKLRITNGEDISDGEFDMSSDSQFVLRNSQFVFVPKARIAEHGDYNLSGERYRDNAVRKSSFPLPRFEEVCTLAYGTSLPKEKRIDGPFPVIGSNGITGYHNEYLVEGPAIIVGRKGSAGEVTLIEQNCFPIDTTYYIKQTEPSQSDIVYLYWVLKSLNLPELKGGAGIPGLNRTDVYQSHQIPLPPLSVQQEIVAEIEGYQKVINGARAVLDNYRPHIPIDPEWPMVELGEVCEINPKKSEVFGIDKTSLVSFVPMADLNEHEMYFEPKEKKKLSEVTSSYTYFKDGDVLIAKVTPCFENGKAGIARNLINGIAFGSSEFYVLRPNGTALSEWLFLSVANPTFRNIAKEQMTGTGGLQRVPKAVLVEYTIPLPPLATQQAIVAEIETERALVSANRELIARMEKKIQGTLARIWGEK